MKPYTYYCSYCNRHLCDDCYKAHIKKCNFTQDMFKLSDIPNVKNVEDHLDYLSSLRNKYSQSQEIQDAYQRCLSSNKEILYLVKFIVKNYYSEHFSLYSLIKEIINLNTQKVFEENEKSVVNYLNSFGFTSMKPFITFKINTLLFLKTDVLPPGMKRLFIFTTSSSKN